MRRDKLIRIILGFTVLIVICGCSSARKASTNMPLFKENKTSLGSTNMEGSQMKGAIINTPVGQALSNVAIGKDNKANLGAVNMEGSQMKGAIVNTPVGMAVTNVAIGKGNKANLAGVNMENSKMNGNIVNIAVGVAVTNVAIGKGNEANLAGVNIENSKMNGNIVNTAVGAVVTNVAIGSGAKANLAGVNMENSSMNGSVVNTVVGGVVTNIAAGSGSEANMGSVIIENSGAGGGSNTSVSGSNSKANINSDLVAAKPTIDEIIKHLRNANLTFNAPGKMVLGEKRQVVLLMSMKLPLPALKIELTTIIKDKTKTGKIYEASLKATKKMESYLTGFGFTVKPITKVVQLVKEDSSTRWEWIVKADELGTQTLFMTVSAFIDYAGEQTTQTIQTFRQEILVYVTPATVFWSWLGRNIAWIAGLIGSIVTLFLGYYIAVLKDRRENK